MIAMTRLPDHFGQVPLLHLSLLAVTVILMGLEWLRYLIRLVSFPYDHQLFHFSTFLFLSFVAFCYFFTPNDRLRAAIAQGRIMDQARLYPRVQ